MVTREKARELALAKIYATWSIRDDEPVIVDEATRAEPFGWVFFYNSKRYRESRNVRFALAGNGPVVVDQASAEVTMLGSAGGVDRQLEEYCRTRIAKRIRENVEPGK